MKTRQESARRTRRKLHSGFLGFQLTASLAALLAMASGSRAATHQFGYVPGQMNDPCILPPAPAQRFLDFFKRNTKQDTKAAPRAVAAKPADAKRAPAAVPANPVAQSGLAWGDANQRMAMKVASQHPGLTGPGGARLVGGLCTNFASLKLPQQQQVLAKIAMNLGSAESNLNPHDRGDEGGGSDQARGVFQLAGNTRNGFGCYGDLVSINPDAVDCVFRIFEQKGVVAMTTHWSNLRPQFTGYFGSGKQRREVVHPFERKFMELFEKNTQECRSTYHSERGPDSVAAPEAPKKSSTRRKTASHKKKR